MDKIFKICIIAALYLITACNSNGQNVLLTDLLTQKPQEVFQAKNIKFKVNAIDNTPNYMLRLFGEVIPPEAVSLLVPEYKIDWDGEKIEPTIFFGSVPLKSPILLLDKNGKILIAIAETGNDGAKGVKQGEVFADADVLNLKAALNKQWGKEKLVRKDFNEGNIYVWKNQSINARLTVDNENFENTSKAMRNDIPQNGRHGVLTVYNGIKPEFYDKASNYFNNPEISK